MERRRISSGSPLEPVIGFSRAVRVGSMIVVAGTAPIDSDGRTLFSGDVFGQTMACLDIAEKAIVAAGGTRHDIVRSRVMLVDISTWREAARAHGEFFVDIRPACTFVGVAGFINPDWLVEIELDCLVSR